MLGFYEQDDPYCEYIAQTTNRVVVNVDYLLAPENKFPIPILSSYEVISNFLQLENKYSFDKTKLTVGGHSAGGNIAAGLSILDREKQEFNIKGQIIDYAPMKQELESDLRSGISDETLSQSRMLKYINWYFDDLHHVDDILASPVNDTCENIPPSLIISAEYDPLRIEEKLFAEKLLQNSGNVWYECFEGCKHGFTQIFDEYNETAAKKAWALMAAFLKHIC